MDRDGGQQRVLTSGPGKRFPHSFASDNRRIAFAGYEKGVWNLYWIDRISGETKKVTNYTAYGSFVARRHGGRIPSRWPTSFPR